MAHKPTATKFCSCIKHVRKTLKSLDRRGKEQRAIAICVKSVLHTRNKTLRRFTCRKKKTLEVQNRLKNSV